MRLSILGWVGVPAVILGVSTIAAAQAQPTTAPAPVDDAEWRRQIETRMRQLEQENAELRTQVNGVESTQQAVMRDAEKRGVLTVEGGEPRLTTPDFFDVNKYAA